MVLIKPKNHSEVRMLEVGICVVLEKNLYSMLLILGGNSEIGAQLRSNLCYLICLRHLIRSREVTDLIFFFSEKTYFPSHVRN